MQVRCGSVFTVQHLINIRSLLSVLLYLCCSLCVNRSFEDPFLYFFDCALLYLSQAIKTPTRHGL